MSNSQCRRNDDLQQDLLSGSCEGALYGRHMGREAADQEVVGNLAPPLLEPIDVRLKAASGSNQARPVENSMSGRGLVEHLFDRRDWDEHPNRVCRQRLEAVFFVKLYSSLGPLCITAIQDIEHDDRRTYFIRYPRYSRQAVDQQVAAVSATSEFQVATDH